MKNIILAFFVVGFGIGCSSVDRDEDPTTVTSLHRHSDYAQVIEKYSVSDAVYDGFYNRFQYSATLHNSPVIEGQLARQGGFLQWDATKMSEEREKAFQEASTNTRVFLSFFAAEKSHATLVGKKSIWRAYLDAQGRRYIGEIKKSTQPIAEIASLYPYYNRWSYAYIIEFPVPLSAIEGSESQFTLTGPVGTSTVSFPAVNARVPE